MVATDGHRLSLIERELAGRLQAQERRHHPAQGPVGAQAAAGRGAGRRVPPGLRGELGAVQEAGPDDGDAAHRRPVPRVPARHPQGGREAGAGAQDAASSRASSASRCSRADKSNAVRVGLVGEPAAHHRATTRTWARRRTTLEVAYRGARHHHRLQRALPHRRADGDETRTRWPSSWVTSTARACCTRRATGASPPSSCRCASERERRRSSCLESEGKC